MSLAPRKPGFYIPLRKHISPDCKRDILFRRGTQIQAGDSLGAACYKRLIPAAKAKAVNHTRDIPQTFWRDDRLPWLELRSTWRSRQAYKRHSHPQLSVGAIIEGETRLRAGDPIADVGYQAGFADQSHFHKTFVSYTAATPRQYAQSRSISDNK